MGLIIIGHVVSSGQAPAAKPGQAGAAPPSTATMVASAYAERLLIGL
jgi:hypothetical protein